MSAKKTSQPMTIRANQTQPLRSPRVGSTLEPSSVVDRCTARPLEDRSRRPDRQRWLVGTAVDSEGRVLGRHQRCVGTDANHPAVEPHDEIEDARRVGLAEEQENGGDQDEQTDQADPADP